jgi:hypothetical protein
LALHDVALLREFLRVPRPSNDYGARDLRLGPALRATNRLHGPTGTSETTEE